MTQDQLILLAILAGTLVLFAVNRWRFDIVAMMALLAAVIAGIVPVSDAFSGFGHPAVITVAMVLILSRAVSDSGVVDVLARSLDPIAKRPLLFLLALCSLAMVLSAFMNNVAALALLMPVALSCAKKAGHSPSFSLMPLSFASILGGMSTLIGTPPNIIVAGYRASAAGASFNMFDFAPVGLSLAFVGIAFITLVGWRLLPANRQADTSAEDLFEIRDYVTELRVPRGSRVVGKTIAAFEQETDLPLTILSIIRQERRIAGWIRLEELQAGDIVLVQTDASTLNALVRATGLELVADVDVGRDLRAGGLAVMEAVVPPDAWIEGRTAAMMWLRSRYGVNLVGVSRQGRPIKERLRSVPIQAGDVLLLQGDQRALPQTIAALGCLPLAQRGLNLKTRKSLLPTGIFAAAIVLMTGGWLPPQIALTAGVVLILILGIMPVRDVYQAVEWPVIVLLGAMIPVGQALETTDAVGLVAGGLADLAGDTAPIVILAMVMVMTMLLTDIMNNAATAVVMAPLALNLAQTIGVNPDAFLMGVAISASSAFLTPIGHQNNTLILGPGGYRFGDYWRLGLPLDIVILITALVTIPLVWGL